MRAGWGGVGGRQAQLCHPRHTHLSFLHSDPFDLEDSILPLAHIGTSMLGEEGWML